MAASGRRTQAGAPAVEMGVQLAPRHHTGLLLRNPITVAAGTFGYGTEYARLVEIQRLGMIWSKGTTLRPRRGAPPPRVCETPAGMLNAIGLQNPGVRAVVKEKAPIWATWQVPVAVNIAGDTVDEYAEVASELEGVPGIAAIELNISCPNVHAGGMAFGADAGMAAEVTSAVRQSTTLPLVVKLSPNVGDIRPIARAVVDAGADALSLINTVVGLAIDVETRRPFLGNVTGGLSGPAVKPLALRLVYQVAQTVGDQVPIVALGGITSVYDVLEFILAGATAVAVGTATCAHPTISTDLGDGLARWMSAHGVADLAEIRAAALR
ncbi:MAG: dihydroorotate dehydrogenase [Chloroflexota bacterium]